MCGLARAKHRSSWNLLNASWSLQSKSCKLMLMSLVFWSQHRHSQRQWLGTYIDIDLITVDIVMIKTHCNTKITTSQHFYDFLSPPSTITWLTDSERLVTGHRRKTGSDSDSDSDGILRPWACHGRAMGMPWACWWSGARPWDESNLIKFGYLNLSTNDHQIISNL